MLAHWPAAITHPHQMSCQPESLQGQEFLSKTEAQSSFAAGIAQRVSCPGSGSCRRTASFAAICRVYSQLLSHVTRLLSCTITYKVSKHDRTAALLRHKTRSLLVLVIHMLCSVGDASVGQLKLCDFGFARQLPSNNGSITDYVSTRFAACSISSYLCLLEARCSRQCDLSAICRCSSLLHVCMNSTSGHTCRNVWHHHRYSEQTSRPMCAEAYCMQSQGKQQLIPSMSFAIEVMSKAVQHTLLTCKWYTVPELLFGRHYNKEADTQNSTIIDPECCHLHHTMGFNLRQL